MRVFKEKGKEDELSHYREMAASRKEGGVKMMPVIDVRDSENHRKKVEHILKQENINRGSKYIKQSYSVLGYSYNISMKK